MATWNDVAWWLVNLALITVGVCAYMDLRETEVLRPHQQWHLDLARWRGAVLEDAARWYGTVCGATTDDLLAWRRTCQSNNKTDDIEARAPPLAHPQGARLSPELMLACTVMLPIVVACGVVLMVYIRVKNGESDAPVSSKKKKP
jgi:hypothetical protein